MAIFYNDYEKGYFKTTPWLEKEKRKKVFQTVAQQMTARQLLQ